LPRPRASLGTGRRGGLSKGQLKKKNKMGQGPTGGADHAPYRGGGKKEKQGGRGIGKTSAKANEVIVRGLHKYCGGQGEMTGRGEQEKWGAQKCLLARSRHLR